MRSVSIPTAYLCFIFLMIYSLFSIDNIIKSLFISFILVLFNNALGPELPLGMFFRYGVFVFCFLSFIIHVDKKNIFNISKSVLYVYVIALLIIFHSLLFSVYASISILKIFFWVWAFVLCVYAWNNIENINKTLDDLYFGLLILVILSIPFVFIPSIGFAVNGTGFQGILNQPQAFGPTVGILGALSFSRIVFKKEKNYLDFLVIYICFVLIILSQARTAGLALIMSIIIYSCCLVLKGHSFDLFRNKKSLISIFFSSGFLVVIFPFIIPFIENYIFKRDEASNLVEAASASRGGLVEKMFINIEKYPLTGIGFGIDSDMDNMEIVREGFFGIPISAAVEKGVLPIAILEELGLFLAILVGIWIVYVLKQSFMNVVGFIMMLFILLVNLGESTLFSAGGLGLLFIIFFSFCITGKDFKYE